MNKAMKRKSIILASVACAVLTGSAVGVLGMNSNSAIQASAETTLTEQSFVMPGASVRIASDPNGIRFPVWLPVSVYEANQDTIIETGTLLCPKKLYDDTQLTVEAYQSETSKTDGAITTDKWVKTTDPKTKTEYYQSMIYLYNISQTDMETEIMARGYVKTATETLYSPIITRSMAEVAYQALQDPAYASYATTLQGYLGNYVVELAAQENAFEVYSAVNTPNNLVYDLSSYATVTEASVAAVVDGERTVLDSQYVTVADNKVTVNGAAFGASVYGDVDLQIITDNNAFETSVNVVTKYISTKEDLDNLYKYGGMDTTKEDKSYDGYFVMTGNIDCNNTVLSYRDSNDYLNRNATAQYEGYEGKYGFRGIFDGQGYKIYNMKLEGQHFGLFGNMAKGSVLKNVALIGSQYYDYWDCFLIAETISGTVTNCYIDFALASTGTNTSEYKLLATALQHSTLSDLVIKYDTSAKTQGDVAYLAQYAGGGYAYVDGQAVNSNFFQNVAQTSNVYVFTQSDRAWIDGWRNSAYGWVWEPMMANIVKSDYDAQVDPVTMTDSTYWNLEGDQPIFKSVGNATRTLDCEINDFEVYSGIVGTTPIANAFTVDLTEYNVPTPTSIKLIGKDFEKTVGTGCFADGVLTIADMSDVYGELKLVIETENCTYQTSSFNVVTKYISTKADFENMIFYGGINLTTTEKAYDGYFVLTADVDCGNAFLNYRNGDYCSGGMTELYNGNYGFAGVFDGQGHKLYNLRLSDYQYGLFMNTQIGSEIKNTAFIGKQVLTDNWSGYLIGRGVSSAITNCYIDVAIDASSTAGEYCLIGKNVAYASLTDVVIKYDHSATTATEVSYLGRVPGNQEGVQYLNAIKLTNTHVFTQQIASSNHTNPYKAWINMWNGEYTMNWPNDSLVWWTWTNHSTNDYDAVKTDITMTDSTYWDLTGNQPVWIGVSA